MKERLVWCKLEGGMKIYYNCLYLLNNQVARVDYSNSGNSELLR